MLFLPGRASQGCNVSRDLSLASISYFVSFTGAVGARPSAAQPVADCEVVVMAQLAASVTPTLSPYAPLYTDDLSRTIGVLQHLQVLLAGHPDATLADVSALVSAMQQEFGSTESLEHVIQSLVGRHLARQIARRPRSVSLPMQEVTL